MILLLWLEPQSQEFPGERLPHVPAVVVELRGGALDAEAVQVPQVPLVRFAVPRLVLQVLGHLVDGQPVAAVLSRFRLSKIAN